MFLASPIVIPSIGTKNITRKTETEKLVKPSPEIKKLNNAFLEEVVSRSIEKDVISKDLLNKYIDITDLFHTFVSNQDIRNLILQILPISYPYVDTEDKTFIINGLSASLSQMTQVLNRINFGLLTIVNTLLSSGVKNIKREKLLVYIVHVNDNVFVESINPPNLYYDPTLYSTDMIDYVLKNHVRFEDKTLKGIEEVFYPIQGNEYRDIHVVSALSTVNDYYDKKDILDMMSKDINVKMFYEILFSAAWFGARDNYEVSKQSSNGKNYLVYKPNYISYNNSKENGTHIINIRIVYELEDNISTKNFSVKNIVSDMDKSGILDSDLFNSAIKEVAELL